MASWLCRPYWRRLDSCSASNCSLLICLQHVRRTKDRHLIPALGIVSNLLLIPGYSGIAFSGIRPFRHCVVRDEHAVLSIMLNMKLTNGPNGYHHSVRRGKGFDEQAAQSRTALARFSDHAMKNSHDYDDAITRNLKGGKSGEALFFELAIEDLKQAADLLYSRLKSCI